MSPPAPDRVPYLRLVPPAGFETQPPLRPVRLGLRLQLSILVETLRRRRSRALQVERLSDHERRDIGLPPHPRVTHPRDLILWR
ncbi:hypothetical protein [Inquilinus limosus]|uniref:DUF1127 domain-containing protein n=1 Tax=Inquilinus limosus MP06 TaxID=1398085 RepID=A0A0A0D3P0_9PROT|nr:hypothetical protein [Inquilinus limosus]KGM32650.1 hypothetical protein P409_20210 [Inquilinus limosus MP06]